MIDTEEEREKFLVVLLALSKRIERAAKKSFNDVFLKAMMKLRRLILRLERGGLIRTLQWDRLRSEIIEILRPIIEVLQSTLPRHLLELDPLANRAAANAIDIDPPPYRERTANEVLRETRVAGKRLVEIIGDSEIFLGSLFAKMFGDLDRMVRGEFLKGTPTQDIANKVIVTTRRFGVNVPKINTGSFANREMNLIMNTIVGGAWDVISSRVDDVMQLVPAEEWEWVATLDPKTCPICRPLDGQRRPDPSLFPFEIPVHPNCRCVILPVV